MVSAASDEEVTMIARMNNVRDVAMEFFKMSMDLRDLEGVTVDLYERHAYDAMRLVPLKSVKNVVSFIEALKCAPGELLNQVTRLKRKGIEVGVLAENLIAVNARAHSAVELLNEVLGECDCESCRKGKPH